MALSHPFNGQSLNLVLYLCYARMTKNYTDALNFGAQGSLFQDVPQKSNEQYQNNLGRFSLLPSMFSVQTV